MTAQTVINLILAVASLGSVLTAVGSVYRLRGQKGIDKATETEIVHRAARIASEKDLNEIAALRRDITALQEESSRRLTQIMRLENYAYRHIPWDREAADKLRANGIPMRDPPTLLDDGNGHRH